MTSSSSLVAVSATAIAILFLVITTASIIDAAPVYAGVRRDTSHFATNELKSRFSASVVTSLANMLGSSAGTTTVAPGSGKTRHELLVEAIGNVEMVDVAEVNDTFTNVQLECSNKMTADAIIEAANVISWNAIKSTGIILASIEGPEGETQGARTVVFFAIVTIVAVVCAGLASWCVRRRAIEKHRGISFTELAGLEEELYQRQEDNVQNNQNQNGPSAMLNQISIPVKKNNGRNNNSMPVSNNTRGMTSGNRNNNGHSSSSRNPPQQHQSSSRHGGGDRERSSRRR